MRTILFTGLVAALALGCGDDDTSSDGGSGADVPIATDVSGGEDASSDGDAGPAADGGLAEDSGPVGDAGPAGPDAGEAESCGGFAGALCDDGDFCEYESGCGVDDSSGLCVTPPDECPRVLDPVCGCDGVEYGNLCMAQMAGQSVQHRGPCTASASCGGRTGLTCRGNQFCAYTRDENCGRADATSTCMTRPSDCADIFEPVCGCDGFDYGNECEANAAGVAVLFDGTCDEP